MKYIYLSQRNFSTLLCVRVNFQIFSSRDFKVVNKKNATSNSRAINLADSIFSALSIELISSRSCWTAAGSRMGQILMVADKLFRLLRNFSFNFKLVRFFSAR